MKEKDFKIRSALLEELDTLLEFEQFIVSVEREYDSLLDEDPINYYDLKKLILSPESEVAVIELDNKIIGSGYVQIRKSESYLKHKYHAYLGFMFIDPDFRGKGYNKLLMNYLQEWSQKREINTFVLNVYSDNKRAIKAYEKSGFKQNILEMTLTI